MNNIQNNPQVLLTKTPSQTGIKTLTDGEIRFLYQTSGESKLIYNDITFHLHIGDIIVLTFPAVFEIISDKNAVLYCLSLTEKFCIDNGMIPSDYTYEKKISDSHVSALFKELLDEYSHDDTLSQHYSYHIAVMLLAHITRNHTTKDSTFILNRSNPLAVERIEKAIKYIENNLERSVTTNELAAHTHISKDYFIHEFKNVTGFTVNQIKSIIRLRRAKNLLSTSTLSISEISEVCGFNHYSYFYTVFKKETGLSPIEYRQKNQLQ